MMKIHYLNPAHAGRSICGMWKHARCDAKADITTTENIVDVTCKGRLKKMKEVFSTHYAGPERSEIRSIQDAVTALDRIKKAIIHLSKQ